MARDIDTRAVTLVDLPLLRRLGNRATVLESTMEYTQYEPHPATLTNLILPQRSLYTMLARADKQYVVGQFRLRPDEQNAHIVYIAPGMQDGVDDTAWLHILDAMAREAGQRHAHALIAEVHEDSHLFETMRTAGYAVYARQEIWRRLPAAAPLPIIPGIEVVEETEADAMRVQSLIAQIIPRLMQPFVTPNEDMDGWVYRRDGRVQAYIGVVSGKQGIFLRPFIHPDLYKEAPGILSDLIRKLARADQLPIYICVSRFLDWMQTTLDEMHFLPGPRQAVMVKHITAGVRQASFKPFHAVQGVAVGSAKSPTSHYLERNSDTIIDNRIS